MYILNMERVTVYRLFTIVAGVIALTLITVGLFVPAWIVFDMRISTIGLGRTGPKHLPPPPPADGDGDQTDRFGLREHSNHVGIPSGANDRPIDHKMHIKMHEINIKTEANIGLWIVSACVDMGEGYKCMPMSMEKFAQRLTQSSSAVATQGFQVFFGHFEALQVLMILGLICSGAGFIVLCLYHRQESGAGKLKSYLGIMSAVLYALASLLVFSAVAAEGHQNTNMANSISMMKTVNPSNETFDMNVHFPWALLICGFGASICAFVQLAIGVWMCKYPELGTGNSDWHEFSNQNQTPVP